MRKVAVFTGTRAEYGLLFWLMKGIQADPDLQLQLIVSGMHLSAEFGNTYQQIEADGFIIDEKVEILLSSDSSVGVAKSMGLGVIGFADSLNRLKPDVLVLLGDRFEALSISQTAVVMRIPILHIHGGEITEGAYDDSIRHAITKFSTVHCTAAEEYRQRVIQLGEPPENVKNVGAIGLDSLKRTEPLSIDGLSESLSFHLKKPFFVVTYHPVTLINEDPEGTFRTILDVLDSYPNFQVIITYPNADNGGRCIIQIIEGYASKNKERVLAVPSLGQHRYLSAVKYASAIIGNSSSGVIEAPSFNVSIVNVGDRQKGRLAADSIVHCGTSYQQIKTAVDFSMSPEHMSSSQKATNPYGSGKASEEIIEVIKTMSLSCIKKFHDLDSIKA